MTDTAKDIAAQDYDALAEAIANPPPPNDALRALLRYEAVCRERDRGRDILADTDIASLPKDHTLELTARARINQLRTAEARVEALEAALREIAAPKCIYMTVAKGIARAALSPSGNGEGT